MLLSVSNHPQSHFTHTIKSGVQDSPLLPQVIPVIGGLFHHGEKEGEGSIRFLDKPQGGPEFLPPLIQFVGHFHILHGGPVQAIH